MQSMKETAANAAASAKAGMEKSKATVQEKVEKMSAHDPMQKEMATQKKEQRKAEAELNKQEAREHNAAAKQVAKAGGHANYTTGTPGAAYGTEPHAYSHTHSPASGTPGYPMGTQQMSAMPGQGTGQPYGGQVDPMGVERTHPTGLPGDTTGHNPRA
ncbi:hypothetical protein P3X46_004394 [Hevea brasiliensis]|uniref:Uncharacterized protein n=1 Tax=Hevea brasiliensis TaxID=3981 RepID=A0ABQ9MZ39_HEVBR|nr:11 kDa late embryogenesis abundant protein [Hevea brasiliensis]KAJ9184692.1 hypothetical protein P3X46_004394 [Hevea brasiliensis]